MVSDNLNYPRVGYGWLESEPDLPDTIGGVFVPRGWDIPTRREEYTLLYEHAYREMEENEIVLDAGTGWVPEWHVAPYILASLNVYTVGIDIDERHMAMPESPWVQRGLYSLTDIPMRQCVTVDSIRMIPYDHIICISVLEHLPADAQVAFAAEAARVTRQGGTLLVTADETDPSYLASLFADNFDIGTLSTPPGTQLQPRVAYVLGRRL